MTQLTDKMEGLRLKQGEAVPFQAIHFNEAIDKCLALVKAEEALVGDWEESLQVEVLDDYLRLANSKYYVKEEDMSEHMEEMRKHYKKLLAFITALLAAKDREIAEERKKWVKAVGEKIDKTTRELMMASFQEGVETTKAQYDEALKALTPPTK